MLKREGFDFEKFAKKAMQDTVTSRELFERMPTRPALAEPDAETFGGWVTSSLQDGDGVTVRHARATDEAMACAGFGNCAITIVMDTASTDGAPKEITARRTVEFLAFLELPAEARALVIAAKKREFGEIEE